LVVNAVMSHANDLADVQVGAIVTQMRVVIVKRVEVYAMGLCHFFASVIWYDSIDLLAVFAWHGQAQVFAWREIRALIVDLRVQNHELIERNTLTLAYRVTNITRLDDVVARA